MVKVNIISLVDTAWHLKIKGYQLYHCMCKTRSFSLRLTVPCHPVTAK
jgi:hypothetical protein